MYDNKPFHIFIGVMNICLLILLVGVIVYFVSHGPAGTADMLVAWWKHVYHFAREIKQ